MADYLTVGAPVVTGPPLPVDAPYSAMGGLEGVPPSVLDATSDAFATAMRFNPTTSLARAIGRNTGYQGVLLDAADADARYGITAYGKKELSFAEPVYEDVAKGKHDLKRQELASRRLQQASEGFLAGAGSLGAGLIASLLDPLNIAAGFIPVAGQARYASALAAAGGAGGRALVRARYGALEGLVGAAVVEPIVYGVARSEQADYTIHDSLLNIAFGGILGGGLHATFGAIGDRAGISGYARERRAIEAEQAKVLDAAGKGQAWLDLPDSPAGERLAGLGESRGWTAWQRAIDDLPLEVKEATLRTAVADLVAHGEVRNAAAVLDAGMTAARKADVDAYIAKVDALHDEVRAEHPRAGGLSLIDGNRNRKRSSGLQESMAIEARARAYEAEGGRAIVDDLAAKYDSPIEPSEHAEVARFYDAARREGVPAREAAERAYDDFFAAKERGAIETIDGIAQDDAVTLWESGGFTTAYYRARRLDRLDAEGLDRAFAVDRIDPDVAAVERMAEAEPASAKTEGSGPRATEIEADPQFAEALETLKGLAAIGRLTEAQKNALADADARIKDADAEGRAWNIAAACAAGGA